MTTPSPEVRNLLGLANADVRGLSPSPIPPTSGEDLTMPAPFIPTNPALLNDEASYITYFEPEFRIAFESGTAISWDILFADDIGGNFDPNSEDFIYVTAWNRAALGCEALVQYYHSMSPALAVFDHRVYRFVARRPIDQLAAYVQSPEVGGYRVRAISVINMTYKTADGWCNEVSLAPVGNVGLLTIYKSAQDYVATLADQTTRFAFNGSYGPTIEPSRGILNPYAGTNPLGWANVKVATRDEQGQWGAFRLLDATQSSVLPGVGGFVSRYSIANSTAILTT